MLIDEVIYFFKICRLCFTAAGINKYFVGAGQSSQSTRLRLCKILETENKVCVSSAFFHLCVCVYKFSSGE